MLMQWSTEAGIATGEAFGQYLTDEFFRKTIFQQGQLVGNFVGQVLFEVLLEILMAVATEGIGNLMRGMAAAGEGVRAGAVWRACCVARWNRRRVSGDCWRSSARDRACGGVPNARPRRRPMRPGRPSGWWRLPMRRQTPREWSMRLPGEQTRPRRWPRPVRKRSTRRRRWSTTRLQ